MKIDFVSDVVCPWCAIGLRELELAIERLPAELRPSEIRFQPFELNPQMPTEGEEIVEHLTRKYGAPPEQLARTREAIRARGESIGFTFGARGRIWNTFDAHRLLHWAGEESLERQGALKRALLAAYHTRGENPGDRSVLLACAAEAGLDAGRAAQVLDGNEFADAVREREQFWLQAGIHSVPAVVIDQRHLISGGQPSEVFERALRQIAAQAQA